jgi:hypothetical protein
MVQDLSFNRLKLLAWDLNPRQVADTNQSNSYTPLLVQNEIITLPSASTIAIQRRQLQNRPIAAKSIAVVADPVFTLNDSRIAGTPPQPTPDTLSSRALTRAARNLGLGDSAKILDRLKYTRTEAEKILALVPEKQRLQALDFNASRATATDPNLAQYQMNYQELCCLSMTNKANLKTAFCACTTSSTSTYLRNWWC